MPDLPVTYSDVMAAAARIAPYAHYTPVHTSATFDAQTGAAGLFKCENFQRTGSFKFRGASNAVAMLSPDERGRGVVTHSSGNHAQALALAASLQDADAVIVMPNNANPAKVAATEGYGARVVQVEPARRSAAAQQIAADEGRVLVHPSNDPAVIAGQATAAVELIDDAEELDVILAPVGGGGLLSGTAVAAKHLLPDCAVIGAEPAMADDAYRSLQTGEIQPSTHPPTIADGLRTQLGDNTFAILRALADEIVLVDEEEIVAAMRWVWERMKLVIEPSSAVPVAAMLAGKVDGAGKRVGIILSGGNADLDAFFGLLRGK